MCEAEDYIEQEAEDSGKSKRDILDRMDYDCYGDGGWYHRGFIFPDGSIIEIGPYEDHRIINMKDWNEHKLITYDVSAKEANFRVHGGLTWSQLEVMESMCRANDVDYVYIDVYNYEDRRMGDITIEGYIPTEEEMRERIYELLY